MTIEMIDLNAIVASKELQSRDAVNEDWVNTLADRIQDGKSMTQMKVFSDGENYYLADGFHRYFAYKKLGIELVDVDVEMGTFMDAREYSWSANASHGMQRNKATIQKIIQDALSVYPNHSDRFLAGKCDVSHVTIANYRKLLGIKKEDTTVVINKDGTERLMNTANIGKGQPVPPKEEAPEEPPEAKIDPRDVRIEALVEMNTQLEQKVAEMNFDGTDEERVSLTDIIQELRDEVKLLQADNHALRHSRDTFQSENNVLKKRVEYLSKKLKETESA